MSLQFEWDEDKAKSNVQKHGIRFEEASSVFNDPLAAIFADEAHSDDEQREILVGYSAAGRLLIVAFTERSQAIRIISARQTTKRERSDHEHRS